MSRRFAICSVIAIGMSVLSGFDVARAATSSSSTGIVSGDFDGDGHDDLAIGVPGEGVGPEATEIPGAGAVNVIYGTATGLSAAGNQLWHQNRKGVVNVAEPFEAFGRTLASGDFDGDGRDDLAVGVQSEVTGTDEINDQATGAVHVFYGTAKGLSAAGDQLWTQDSPGVKDRAEDFDIFGASLAAGNLGRSRQDDLAIGVLAEDVPGPGDTQVDGAGAVNVLYGSKNGLRKTDNQFWHQNVLNVEGAAGMSENFGTSIAISNFGRSNHKDLAVGVPDDTAGEMNDVDLTGAVNVLYGSNQGVRAKNDQRWTQNSPEIEDDAETGDGFGWALASANVGRSGHSDLVVGSPYEDVGPEGSEVPGAGAVNVIFGSKSGLKNNNDQFWTQDSDGIDDGPEDGDSFGNSVTAGNFGNGSRADIAIGTIEDFAGNSEGLVHVIYGTPLGPTSSGSQIWHQDSAGIADNPESSDNFGLSLTSGDFGKSSPRDLAIGVRGENDFAGAVNVLFGGASGISAAGDQFWTQDSTGIKDTAEADDAFSAGESD